MKIITIIGARPQFVKAAAVSMKLRKRHEEIIVHTGQHYDENMSKVFFNELGIPKPDFYLGIGSGAQGKQTGRMLESIEQVLLAEKPDMVMVYGDTNSTIAGALAACKLMIPIAHVEAGLRSFNKTMPEEHNRILTDHCSNFLFCPTKIAVSNLAGEGIAENVFVTGDVMYDAVLNFTKTAEDKSGIMKKYSLKEKNFFLLTVHRPYNTDDPKILLNILNCIKNIKEPVIFPIHPRTRKTIEKNKELSVLLENSGSLNFIDPVGYLDMLMLEKYAKAIITDSGGIQKEAYFFGVPCVTLRPETEWLETVEEGWNVLVGNDPQKIFAAINDLPYGEGSRDSYGDGSASTIIADILNEIESSI